jgi:hypothetical protein
MHVSYFAIVHLQVRAELLDKHTTSRSLLAGPILIADLAAEVALRDAAGFSLVRT